MKTWQQVLLGFLLGLITAGVLLLIIRSPQDEPIKLAPIPTNAPIIVHITGAVTKPGVYSLPVGSRVIDLVETAGGFAGQAYTDSLNLAGELHDGEKIYIPNVPEKGEPISIELESGEITDSEPKIVNINAASEEELQTLPGIGPSKAAQIIDYRKTNGSFRLIEDIMDVPGIGPSLFEKIQNLITVD